MSDTGPQRIQRVLARAGVASRRAAEELVAAGRVTVNGEVAQTGQSVDPAVDRIAVDGKPVTAPPDVATWLVLHKPAGYVTSRRDPSGRPTVFDLVKDVPGLTYVGRLDLLTEGVLLLTTDGTAAHRLTHPSRELPRTYVATVRGDVRAAVRQLRDGVALEDGEVLPEEVEWMPLGRGRTALTLTIREGRNREVRRLCEAIGLEVEHLVRTRFGPVTLGDLPVGETRALSNNERTAFAMFDVTVPKTPGGARTAAKEKQREAAREARDGAREGSRESAKRGGRPAGRSPARGTPRERRQEELDARPGGKASGKGKAGGRPAAKSAAKSAAKPAGKRPSGAAKGPGKGPAKGSGKGAPANRSSNRPASAPAKRGSAPRGPSRVSQPRDRR